MDRHKKNQASYCLLYDKFLVKSRETTLGGQLYIYRCVNDLTQKDISSMLKIDRLVLTKIENNKKVEFCYIKRIENLIYPNQKIKLIQ